MTWRGFSVVVGLALWIFSEFVTCEKDANTCSFYYWRVNWQTAMKTCKDENKQLLCYKSKKEIDDITEAFRLAALGTASLDLWLSRTNCSSHEMEECLSLHIQKSGKTVWHYFQTECEEEDYPFVCCVTGSEETTTSNEYVTNLNLTSDYFELKNSSLLTTTHTSSTSKTPFCKSVRRRGVLWPDTEVGGAAIRPCPGNSTGEARWVCERTNNGRWKNGGPDMTKCRSLEVKRLKNRFNSSSASDVLSDLNHLFKDRSTEMFSEDLTDLLTLMTALPDRLFEEMESLSGSAKWTSTRNSVDKAMSVVNRMVELDTTWQEIDEKGKPRIGTHLLSTVDGMGSLLADSMPEAEQEQSIIKKNMALQVTRSKFGEMALLPQWDVTSPYSHRGYVMLEKGYDSQVNKDNGNVSLVFAVYTDLSNILSPAPKQGENKISLLNSAILSTTMIQGRKAVKISKDVRILVEHLTPSPNETACVFWNVDRYQWDTTGCRLEESNDTYSVCVCNHLTNFALLMDYEDVLGDLNQKPFHYITLVGCLLSIICLFVCIIVFSCYSYFSRHSWGLRYSIHRNLCICLLLANLVLVIGQDKTDDLRMCAIIAGLLHYFFLAAFSWMLLEAVHIYLLLVVVFASRRSHSEKYYIFGYGFPLVIVIITALSRPSSYGTDHICWLSSEKGAIWAFMGPVACILLLNTAALILAQYKASRISAKDDKAALLKRWLRVTLILFPVLGITWLFGFLYLGRHFEVVGYLFAIFNSFQGVCIFVFHCLFDKKARKMIMDSLRKKQSSVDTGSSGTQRKKEVQQQNGTKSNSITPVENDDSNKIIRIQKAFPSTKSSKKDWSKWRKPWSFCFEMPVSEKKNSTKKVQDGTPQAIVVNWHSLHDKGCA